MDSEDDLSRHDRLLDSGGLGVRGQSDAFRLDWHGLAQLVPQRLEPPLGVGHLEEARELRLRVLQVVGLVHDEQGELQVQVLEAITPHVFQQAHHDPAGVSDTP